MTVSTYSMLIDGEPRDASESFDVLNPATEDVAGQAPRCSSADLETAMVAAQRAFASWREDEVLRRDVLRKSAGALMAAADNIAPVLTMENGRPLPQAVEEVYAAAAWLSYFADLDAPNEIIQSDDAALVEVVRRPMGVVAAITPWNFPLALACWKLGPALRAGNTVVLKPSPFTPLSTLAMGHVLSEWLPPGVLNVVSGDDELGSWMTRHPIPRKVTFTGSTAAGRKVAAAAVQDLKRITLELGGNDAAIVLDDADVALVAERIFAAAFANCGQVCAAVKRVFVPIGLADELIDALAERARAVVVGNGLEPETEMGPLSTAPQYERVQNLLDDAFAHGATAVAGGGVIDRPGYFIAPTILRDITEGARVVDEEQFGPVLPVLVYQDVDEAVNRANSSEYGLCGSVWSSDPDRAALVAARLECGTAWVNTHLALGPHQPFGGLKSSGIGVENGPWGLASFSELQVLYRAR